MKKFAFIIVPTLFILGLFIYLGMQNETQSEQESEDTPALDSDVVLSSEHVGQFDPNDNARDLCVNHGSSISMHIHPIISIYIDGEQVSVPTDIGIVSDCMSAIHTHDTTGKIHVEYPEQRDFVLGDFFAVWGAAFSETELFDLQTNFQKRITMMVDGVPSDAFEQLILRDNQQIEIRYE